MFGCEDITLPVFRDEKSELRPYHIRKKAGSIKARHMQIMEASLKKTCWGKCLPNVCVVCHLKRVNLNKMYPWGSLATIPPDFSRIYLAVPPNFAE